MHIAVIGGGYWGAKHLRVLASMSSVDQVTLVEIDPERRKNLAGAFPSIRAVESVDDALDGLDGAVIATRSKSHVPLGLKMIRAGKHVLIEKPMATSLSDAKLLCVEAEAAGVSLMVGHTFEFNPAVIELKARIVSGELGDIHYIRSNRLNLGLYQADVNVIWDLAPHDVSIINFLLDDTPTRVTAWGRRSMATDFEDVAMIRLEYSAPDVEAYVHVSWLDPAKVRETTVVGSKKMAVYDDVKSEERLRLYDRGVSINETDLHRTPMSYRYGDITSPYIDLSEPLVVEDQHFVDSMRTGHASKSNGESGYRTVGVLEAAERSLAEQRPIEISNLVGSRVGR